ncbi:MmgE/PrpD family protein [Streptomyces sp. NPDC052042]|uniref:MmgE/PrpD family protein n=1 Tax=Streptomyces sp. NPDC052042 TaxID=3365683 RepID=UPI0037D8C9A7
MSSDPIASPRTRAPHPERPLLPHTSLTARLADWAHRVTYDDIPALTREAAISQLISNLAAVRASMAHPLGKALVSAFGSPLQGDAGRSAHVLSALATALDFDEVAYAGHVSAGAVNVAAAEARHGSLDGRSLLAAIVVANECAARITAATILSPFFRGQTNTHCHSASAAAARLHARRAPCAEWTAALGLALGILSVPLHHGVVTSDVKALTAAAPVRIALDACDAAAHGLSGADDILEHPDGLLAHLSAVPVPKTVDKLLGVRWHTDSLTYKRFPGSAYLHAAFDCAERLHERLGRVDAEKVRRITVAGSLLTSQMEQKVAPALRGPLTPVPAATLSVGYGVATLLLTGSFGVRDLDPAALGETSRWALADKVVVEHDMDLSLDMARATSPLGEALREAGERALDWLELKRWGGAGASVILASLGASEETFENATMAIGARVRIELVDGTVAVEECKAFAGSAGASTRDEQRTLVRRKFLGTGAAEETLSALEDIGSLGPGTVSRVLEKALDITT